MRYFTHLFLTIDQTNSTLKKVEALVRFLDEAPDNDKLWAVALLAGKRPKRSVRTNQLREWAAELAGIPLWLFEDSYHVVGDLAETIASVLSADVSQSDRSLANWMAFLKDIKNKPDEDKKAAINEAWLSLSKHERFVFNKLLTGGFRMGVSQKLMVRALSKHLNEDENMVAHRLMGNWNPEETSFQKLLVEKDAEEDLSKPYPFYLAYQLDKEAEGLGNTTDWNAEYKWDGIRGQLIHRKGTVHLWSRGEELITERFPEFTDEKSGIQQSPQEFVLDGEILPFRDGEPLPFQVLQTRIGRKKVGKKTLEKAPVILMAYDLIELNGKDLRQSPFSERRAKLEKLVKELNSPVIQLSKLIEFNSWKKLQELQENAREVKAEGIMLKQKKSPYLVGRKKGDWWKWKVDPLLIDGVMIYAMRGHGRRANLYSDYTFAVWKGNELIPFTKAYSGLTDKEMREVDRFVKQNTIERFGPVRSVEPEMVFEIAFEGIARSSRHKSGVALRFPRINRIRHDKKPAEANKLEDLEDLIEMIEV
jgi:DNA ligase-1